MSLAVCSWQMLINAEIICVHLCSEEAWLMQHFTWQLLDHSFY